MNEIEQLRKELHEEHLKLQHRVEKYMAETDKRIRQLIQVQEGANRSQQETNKQMAQLVKETAGVVAVYKNATGAIRTGVAVQRFGLWLVKWPLVGLGLYTAWTWMTTNIERFMS